MLDSDHRQFTLNAMCDIIFMKADSRSATIIEEIEKNVFCKPWNLKNIEESIANRLNYSEIAVIDGESAGCIIYSKNSFEAELLRIGVKEKFRNKGLAGALLKRMFDTLSEDGISEVFLEVNENNQAVKFYNKNGFTEIARRKNYYGNENAIIMKATINTVNNENNKS